MFQLNQRKILVTGASGGLGSAIAKAFHQQGAVIAISGRNIESLEKLKKELGQERVHVVPCDLNKPEEVETLISQAAEAMDGIDTLINNAGITKDGLLLMMKLSDWQDVLRVNLEVAFCLSKAALRPMLKERFGRIINITSVVGVMGNPGQANYAAAKAGLIGFSKSLAKEVAARGITVNCIAPGFIRSAMTDVLNEEQRQKINQNIPMGYIGDATDIAAAAVFLASKEAGYVTGQTLHVNGGLHMV